MMEPLNLVLERLDRMDEPLGRLESGQSAIPEELRAQKRIIAGALHFQSVHEATLAELAARLDRVERRLDLREQP